MVKKIHNFSVKITFVILSVLKHSSEHYQILESKGITIYFFNFLHILTIDRKTCVLCDHIKLK
jgi:hypothetical protein